MAAAVTIGRVDAAYMAAALIDAAQIAAARIAAASSRKILWSAPCRLFAHNGVGHRTVAEWREESFEDLHPRGSGSGYDAVTDLLSIASPEVPKTRLSEIRK